MNNCETDQTLRWRDMQDTIKRLKAVRISYENTNRPRDEKEKLIKVAIENCENGIVLQWLQENAESSTFNNLVDIFQFLKKHIDEEEKKSHSDHVDITFLAHGAIRDFMIPASCLMPLPTITDVVLYAPWNCITCGAAYGIATGRIKPQHRVFYCRKKKGCTIPDEKHQPVKLPDHWNSMKNSGACKIPNITVNPLRPDDSMWANYQHLIQKHGPLGRNRIVIPFFLPEKENESLQFSVVMLALSLVLRSSRFKATVHLNACLGDQSARRKFDKEQLSKQYAYTIDNTKMKVSPDMLSDTNR